MDWLQVMAIISTLLAGVAYIHADVKEMRREAHQQGQRTDRLYEMFVDLLKDKK